MLGEIANSGRKCRETRGSGLFIGNCRCSFTDRNTFDNAVEVVYPLASNATILAAFAARCRGCLHGYTDLGAPWLFVLRRHSRTLATIKQRDIPAHTLSINTDDIERDLIAATLAIDYFSPSSWKCPIVIHGRIELDVTAHVRNQFPNLSWQGPL